MKEEIKTTKMKNTSNKVFSLEEVKEIWKAGQEYWKTSGESKTFEETIEPLGELLFDRKFTLEDISKTFVGETKKGGLFDDYLDYRIKIISKNNI